MLDLHSSKLTHIRTFAGLDSFWTFCFSTSLNLHLSNLTHFDLHLSKLADLGFTFVELAAPQGAERSDGAARPRARGRGGSAPEVYLGFLTDPY